MTHELRANIDGLLPCPRCGCEDVRISHETYAIGISHVRVTCPRCVYWGPAETAYNRRYKDVDQRVTREWNEMVRHVTGMDDALSD